MLKIKTVYVQLAPEARYKHMVLHRKQVNKNPEEVYEVYSYKHKIDLVENLLRKL